MEIPVLTTDRLVLRETVSADAADVLVFRGDPIVQRFDDPPLQTLQESVEFIEEIRRDCESQKIIAWGITIKDADRVIGLVSLQFMNQGDRYHRRAEIGYGLARSLWGQGIGSEAVRAVIHYGFGPLELNRIYAGTIAVNHESVRMLERLGFVRDGTKRENSLEDDGQFYDSAMYGLIRSDWGYERL